MAGREQLPLALATLLPLVLLLLLESAERVDARQCAHAVGEELLERLERRLDLCLGANAFPDAREALTSAFTANEFDRQAPLALALFSNSSAAMDSLASAVATALFGDAPSPRSVQIADLARLLAAETQDGPRPSNYEVKQALRSALATPLRACPARSLFVVRNVQALDDDALPVLDVFLDPLNGRRAQFQSLDCTNSVFLFLFQVDSATGGANGRANASRLWTAGSGGDWREFLMRRWTRPAETHAAEEFTPQAMVGRLTAGIALMSYWVTAPLESELDAQWTRTCRFPLAAEPTDTAAVPAEDASDWAVALGKAFVLLLPFLWLLLNARRWNQETARKRERAARGRITRHKGKGRRVRRKRW